MQLLVQRFLELASFKELANIHGVYPSFSKDRAKCSLNYSQIEARDDDLLSQECRGLILSKADGSAFDEDVSIIPGKTTIVAFPMSRFFNYNQGAAANIDWSDPNLSIMDKLDGSCIILWYDKVNSCWEAATRSVPYADQLMDNGIYTFRTLFEKAVVNTLGLSFNDFCQHLNKNNTYCFELCTPINRIVVDYKDYSITLLAARSLKTLKEIDLNIAKQEIGLNIPLPKEFKYSTVEELVNFVSSLNPLENEGVVVKDSKFNRIKIKNAAYVAYNKLNQKLGSSKRNLMEFILLECDDDVYGFLAPELAENMTKMKNNLLITLYNYDSLYLKLAENANKLPDNERKKAFALSLNNINIYKAPFFEMYSGKVKNMKEFIMKNKKEGTWSDTFLDKMIELSELKDI